MPPCCFHTETIQQNCLHAKPQNKSNCLPHQTHTNKSNKLCTNLTSLSHLNHIAKPPPHQTLNPKFSAFSLNPNFIAFFLNPKLNHFQMRRTLCEHMNTKHISKSLPSCEPFRSRNYFHSFHQSEIAILVYNSNNPKINARTLYPLVGSAAGPNKLLEWKKKLLKKFDRECWGRHRAICVRVDNFVTWC
jgi:hypothetical protein